MWNRAELLEQRPYSCRGGMVQKVWWRGNGMKAGFCRQNASGAIDQSRSIPCCEVCGEKDRRIRRGKADGGFQQSRKIAFEAECFSSCTSTECGGIEDDGIESFAPFDKSPEVGGHILWYKSMTFARNAVQFEIPASPLQ